jgi:tight adherence protein B
VGRVTVFVIVLVSMLAGVGLLLVGWGAAGRVVLPPLRRASGDAQGTSARSGLEGAGARAGFAVVGAVGAFAVSGWPVAGVGGAILGWVIPSGVRAGGRHQRELELVEAIATWAEQLRDTISAASGLEQAIGATAPLAPAAIAGPVQRLAARVQYERLNDGLRRFADEVAHPMADFVVAALVTASQHQARELGSLLGHLSSCARDDATMRTRVWVGRARTRSAVRIIVGVVLIFVAGLLAFDREYLAAYDSAAGQAVLALVLAMFGGSFVAMEAIGRVAVPDRFIGRRPDDDVIGAAS